VELQWQERRIPWITPLLYLYSTKIQRGSLT